VKYQSYLDSISKGSSSPYSNSFEFYLYRNVAARLSSSASMKKSPWYYPI